MTTTICATNSSNHLPSWGDNGGVMTVCCKVSRAGEAYAVSSASSDPITSTSSTITTERGPLQVGGLNLSLPSNDYELTIKACKIVNALLVDANLGATAKMLFREKILTASIPASIKKHLIYLNNVRNELAHNLEVDRIDQIEGASRMAFIIRFQKVLQKLIEMTDKSQEQTQTKQPRKRRRPSETGSTTSHPASKRSKHKKARRPSK